MRTLKREEVNGREYRNRAEAEASIGAFIEEVYNRQRRHSALAYSGAGGIRNAPTASCLASLTVRQEASLPALSASLPC
jgi:transposase InsO family protein